MVKDEVLPGMDIFSCLDVFSLVLGSSGDIIYVSDNVNTFIGLCQVQVQTNFWLFEIIVFHRLSCLARISVTMFTPVTIGSCSFSHKTNLLEWRKKL